MHTTNAVLVFIVDYYLSPSRTMILKKIPPTLTKCMQSSFRQNCHRRLLSSTPIEVEQTSGIRRIILANEKARNALSLNVVSLLKNAVMENAHDRKLRCIVISAKGPVFSSGFNLKELADSSGRKVFDDFNDLMMSMINSPIPIIAAVDGHAAAAGCQLVAQCDIAVCSPSSKFSTPGASFGVFCSSPGIPVVRSVGRKIAMHMLFTGYPLSADEALRSGLVSAVSEPFKLDDLLQKTTDGILSKSRDVIELGKKFLYEQMEMNMATAYEKSASVMRKNLELEDGFEGLKSFIEKRKPVWK